MQRVSGAPLQKATAELAVVSGAEVLLPLLRLLLLLRHLRLA